MCAAEACEQPPKALGLCKKHYARYYYKLHPRTPEQNRRNWLRSKFGISVEEYEEILSRQGGGCAICGASHQNGRGWALSVDHDHSTGEIRGLLCTRCNTAIGLLDENTALLARATHYLREGNRG